MGLGVGKLVSIVNPHIVESEVGDKHMILGKLMDYFGIVSEHTFA